MGDGYSLALPASGKMDDEQLEKLAIAELIREAESGAERAKEMGPSGWKKCPLPPTNKSFLRNTILSAVRDSSRRVDRKASRPTNRKRSRSSFLYSTPIFENKSSTSDHQQAKQKVSKLYSVRKTRSRENSKTMDTRTENKKKKLQEKDAQ